jgi:hypothetical protein
VPGFLAILLLVALIGLLSWWAWLSLQSLLQARLLLRIRSLASHLPDQPGPAAVRGRITITGPIRGNEECVWFRRTTQVYERRGKNSGWKTVADDQYAASFVVEAGGRVFLVDDFPTEAQGVESNTEYLDSAWLGLFQSSGNRRVVHRWLRTSSHLTVLGRLERKGDQSHLVKDNKVGLFFSPHEAGRAAGIELAKGVAGLLAVTAALAGGLWFYYQHKG